MIVGGHIIESSKKHTNHIERERDIVRKQEEEEEMRVLKKKLEDTRKMTFIEADEKTLLSKIRQCAQNFAVDSNSYMEPLQGFKGSALLPSSFNTGVYCFKTAPRLRGVKPLNLTSSKSYSFKVKNCPFKGLFSLI